MNPVVWASMQSPDILECVDRMIPGLVQEKDVEELPRRIQDNVRAMSRSSTLAMGLTLVGVGVAMLVPGPVDAAFAAVGLYFGGPTGAVIGVAIYNIMAVIVIAAGVILIVAGLLGL